MADVGGLFDAACRDLYKITMKIRLIKLVDRLAGGMLAAALPSPRPRPVPVPLRFLLIRPGGIGDAVLLVPALRVLQSAYPGCTIDILAEKRNAAAFGFISGIRTVHCYDSLSGMAAVLRSSYDVVIDSEQWYRLSAVVARLTRAPMLIGFASNARRRLFTHPVSYCRHRYEAHSFFGLLEPLGIESPDRIGIPFLDLEDAALRAAEKLLVPLRGKPFVTVFPGASGAQKQWGSDNFRELITRLSAVGIAAVIIGGEDTRPVAGAIASGGIALDLAGRSSLAVTAALIARGRALVCGDSGVLHIAAGLGTPTVSLFGPSDPGKWAPKGERHLALSSGLPCAPCARFGAIPSCPVRGRCLADLTVAQVVAAVRSLVDREDDREMLS